LPALTSIANGQLSDASQLNQYRSLFRGNLFFDARNGYGVLGDLKTVTDGAMTSGSAVLTCTGSAPFTAADVGKHVEVAGAGANQLSTPGSAPTTAASTAPAAASMPAGAYTFAYSYTNAYGETLLSPASTPAITTTGGSPSVTVTFTAMPSGAGVVKIYVVTGPAGTVGFTGVTAPSGTSVVVSQANAASAAPSSNTASAVLSTTITGFSSATQVTLGANAGTSVGLLSVPTNGTFTQSATGGTLGAATYTYRVTALSASGGETTPSTGTSIVVSSGTTNTVTVVWGAVAGAVGYNVYGRASGTEQLLASVGVTTSYLDTGVPVASGALPTVNRAGAGFSYGSDDTAALQAVADALPKTGGATLILAGSSFISSPVLFSAIDNLSVLAYGSLLKLTARVDWGDSGSAYRHGVQFQDCTNLQIVGLGVDGNGAALKSLATTGQFTCLGLTSSVADIRSATVKSTNLMLADCDIFNIRSIGIGLRLVNGATIQDSRFTTLWCEPSGASVLHGHCFAIRCDNVNFDGNYVDGSGGGGGAVGFMCGPGASSGGVANYFLPYLNYAQNLNYLQMASFVAPPATSATSTITIGYGQVTAPGPAPTVGDGGVAGTLTAGTYTVGYTYVNAFGETTISSTATTASLSSGHQISIGAISGIPNYVQFLKFYITATSGTSALGFALQVPVTANATSATNITAPGNTVTAPASNGTAAAETDTSPSYILNDWYFVCATAGSGTNAGIIPGDAIKASAVDQVNKTITFQRMDGTEGDTTAALNWAGQKVYFYSIATRLFCKNIEVSHNTLRNFTRGTNTGGGCFLGGVKNFVIDGNQGDNCADVVLDCEWVCKGQISNNTLDNGLYNTCIGMLHFVQDVAITGNALSGAQNGILVYTNAAIASDIVISDNSVRGSNIGIQCQQNYGDAYDMVLEGLTIKGNLVRGGPRYGNPGQLSYLGIQVGRNYSKPADLGGYMRDVLIEGNIVENCAQYGVHYAGVTALSILGNHLNSCGYAGVYDENGKAQSTRVLLQNNVLNNLGYRSYTATGLWRSTLAPSDPPKIGANHWRNVDSTLDDTQAWYRPADVATHPTGPDYTLLGNLWLRTNSNQLQTSLDSTKGSGDGLWKTLANLTDAQTFGAAQTVAGLILSAATKISAAGQTGNTSAANVANQGIGTVALPALAAATSGTVTVTDARITTASIIQATVARGTTTPTALGSVVVAARLPGSGSCVFDVRNTHASTATLSTDYTLWYWVVN
jgi:hypothetical protein